MLKSTRVATERKRLNKRQRQMSKSREKGIVVIKRQLSVHIDFPVLCGVRLELCCSLPEGFWRQWLLCRRRRGVGCVERVLVSLGFHDTVTARCNCVNMPNATFSFNKKDELASWYQFTGIVSNFK